MLLITDGAKELHITDSIEGVNVHSKISTGINKAVLAEVSIRKARAILREFELLININNVNENRTDRIKTNIKQIFKLVEDKINLKAKIKSAPDTVLATPEPKLNIGAPVFALNFSKYFPYQMGSSLDKVGYMQNWYYEPFKVVRSALVNGAYKHALAPFTDLDTELKYHFYEDQVQPVDPRFVADYIKAFRTWCVISIDQLFTDWLSGLHSI
jgi:hypothetical protein